MVLQRFSEAEEQTGATLEAVNWVRRRHLQTTRYCGDVQLLQPRTVHLEGLSGVAAEGAGLEHLQAGHGEALAAAVDSARLLALVLPLGAGASVEQDGNEEQVEQAARALLVVDGRGPRGHELVNSRAAANVKVLPSAVGRDCGVVGGIVALDRGGPRVRAASRRAVWGGGGRRQSHLDYGHDKASDVSKLGHVDGEVLELVLLCLFQHQLGAVAHRIDAAQVAGGVERWIGRLGQRHVWKAGRARAVWRGARGAQRAIRTVWVAATGRNLGLGALAAKETHRGQGKTQKIKHKKRRAGGGVDLARIAGGE